MFIGKKSTLEHQLLEAEVHIEKQQEDIENLKSLLSKMSLAANNLSPSLDLALNELRFQIKNDASISNLMKSMELVSKQVVHLDDKSPISQQSSQINAFVSKLIEKTINELQKFDVFKKEDSMTIQHLLSASDNDDYVITRFIEITHAALEVFSKQERQAKSSLKYGAASTDQAAHYCHEQFNEALNSVLGVITPPDSMQPIKDDLIDLLMSKVPYSDSPKILLRFSNLLTSTYYQEQKNLNQFIEALNLRFIEVNNFLKDEMSLKQSSAYKLTEFNGKMDQNIETMQLHYQSCKDLKDIMQQLDSGFNEIRSNIKEFHEFEMSKQKDSKCKIKSLQRSLKTTQQKTISLQESLKLACEKSQKDSLTGLYNRDTYEKKLDNILTQIKLLEFPCIMAVVDIDYFKKINDTHGHLSGDTVLKEVAQLLQNNIRKHDFIARYGGEEFVMILNDINAESAIEILEKIRLRIESMPFKLKEQDIYITISIGYTLINSNDTKESAFARADSALYQAKEGGRNQLSTI